MFELAEDNVSLKGFSVITDIDGGYDKLAEIGTANEVPILPVRNMVVFPGVIVPIMVNRKSSANLTRKAEKEGMLIGIVSQKEYETVNPGFSDLCTYGVFARIIKLFSLPTGGVTAICQSFGRMKLESLVNDQPYLTCRVSSAPEQIPDASDIEYHTAMEYMKKEALTLVALSDEIPDEATMALQSITDNVLMLNFVCNNLIGSIPEKMELLNMGDMKERLFASMKIMDREIKLQKLKQDIRVKTHNDLEEQQRTYFLHQQLKNIKEQLHEDTDENKDIKELKAKAEKMEWNQNVAEYFNEQLGKLEQMSQHSPDYSTALAYLQTMTELPWNKCSEDDRSLKRARKVLDADHFGMEKVKERILEYIAVLSLRDDLKSPILCLYGPPGVGKTSLGKSIAKALRREYVRVSLGGLHDEAEIRGHRRTYIGAMPGRIIKGIQKAGTSNPVFILDEIDKVTQGNVHGDPASALLEVLDPEQNNTFHDNYLDYDYDLSKVMFIATANDISTIPRPLLDRMELIEVSGYTTEEKTEIAKKHLVPKEKENCGLQDHKELKLNKPVLEYIIERYTRESGVRQLEKQINKLMRRLALEIAEAQDSISSTSSKISTMSKTSAISTSSKSSTVSTETVEHHLGKPRFSRDIYQGNKYAGVVTGLAWTAVGGEILFIETSLSRGKQQKLTITGNLGDVMKESAMLALEYCKAHADFLKIDYRIFDEWNIHIHVPEGATPKDGPSAGITIATSIASALTQRKVRKNVAMTGEITLRGKVLPVGGIKEKILAAKRAGITDILICQDNRKDIDEIPEKYLKGVSFHYVENVTDVWNFALTDELVDNPIDLTVNDKETSKENK